MPVNSMNKASEYCCDIHRFECTSGACMAAEDLKGHHILYPQPTGVFFFLLEHQEMSKRRVSVWRTQPTKS